MAQNMTRDQLIRKIEQTQEEIRSAGPVHKRDLGKHLHRMRVQLARYDRYQAAARKGVA